MSSHTYIIQWILMTVGLSQAVKMKSILVAEFCTLLAVFLIEECKSAPGKNKASPSNPATLDNNDVDITLYAGRQKIRFLVTILDLENGKRTTVMCNGALIGERDILTVAMCAREIAVSRNLNRYRVRVAEGLDAFYMDRLKHIACVDYDVNYENGIASQLAWIVLRDTAAVSVMAKTIVTNIKSENRFTMHTVIDEDESEREQLYTAPYPRGYESFTKGGTLGLDKVTLQIIKDSHQGITCGGNLFFNVPSKFTEAQIQQNYKRITGFLLFSNGWLQGIGLVSGVRNNGNHVDLYARVNKKLIDEIPKTNRQSLPGYAIGK